MVLRGLLLAVACLGSLLGLLAVYGTGAGADSLWESRRAEALEHRIGVFTRLEELKGKLAAEVVAGRMSLREAGREVERGQESLEDGYEDVLGAVEVLRDEAACRNVITWVRVAIQADPEQAGRILPRLEEELRRDFPR